MRLGVVVATQDASQLAERKRDRTVGVNIVLRTRSAYFKRSFPASCFVLKGFDKGVNSPPTYLNNNHCSMLLPFRTYNTTLMKRNAKSIRLVLMRAVCVGFRASPASFFANLT